MKSMRPPLVAIFFMTHFHRARGMAPQHPLDPLLGLFHCCHFVLGKVHNARSKIRGISSIYTDRPSEKS